MELLTDPILLIVGVLVVLVVAVGGYLLSGTRRRDALTEGDGDTAIDERTAASVSQADDDSTVVDLDDDGATQIDVDQADLGAETAVKDETRSIVDRFRLGLSQVSSMFGKNLRTIFANGLDDDAWEELEDSLIAADVGVDATLELVAGLKERVKEEGITDGDEALALLKEILRMELGTTDRTLARRDDGTTVWLFTGVNGTGKTTSIGKLANRETSEGQTVVLAAADTFRAAAGEQLEVWGERAGARVVKQSEGADPAAVAFDGWQAASSADADLLMIDTAGRLQNKTELMAELTKVKRVVERDAGPIDEVLLVLDATTGQNGLSQAKAFTDAVDVTGVILTKLDGTAKGGIVVGIQRALDIPVKLVGLGEGVDDLAFFDPDAFVDALFDQVLDGPDRADGADNTDKPTK